MEAFGVPNVRLHPGAGLLLPKFESIKQVAQLASMPAALGSGEDLSLVWSELVKGPETDTHRDSVVVVGHASASKVPRDELDLHLRGHLALEDVREVAKLVGTATHELIQVDELRNFFLLVGETLQKRLLTVLDSVLPFPVLLHLHCFAFFRSLIGGICSCCATLLISTLFLSAFVFHSF